MRYTIIFLLPVMMLVSGCTITEQFTQFQHDDRYFTLNKANDRDLRSLADRINTSCTQDSDCRLRSAAYYDPDKCSCIGGSDYADDSVFAVNKNDTFRCAVAEEHGVCYALFTHENTHKYKASCINNQCVKEKLDVSEES